MRVPNIHFFLRAATAVICVCTACACSNSDGSENPPSGSAGTSNSGPTTQGYASYHQYDGIGASSVKCNLDPKSFAMMVTALRTDLAERYASEHGRSVCGMCARVTANGTSVLVHIIDHSNDYSNNGGKRYLDLSAQAFAKLDSVDKGVIPVSFEITECR